MSLVGGVAAVLSGCGQNMCVAGLGNCQDYFNKLQQQPTTPTTGALSVSSNPVSVVVGGQATFTAAGGQPPYTYAITNPITGSTGTISTAGNIGTYYAPSTIPVTPYQIQVTATDANKATGIATLNVTAQ